MGSETDSRQGTRSDSLHEARADWAFDVLAAEIGRGRLLGYIPGDVPTGGGDPTETRLEIEQRFGADSISASLNCAGCTVAEQDALWLLACCEREPALARLVEAINADHSDQLSIAFLERTFGCRIESMLTAGLVQLDRDQTSRTRRGVQVARLVRELLWPSATHVVEEAALRVEDLAIDAETIAMAQTAVTSKATVVVAGLAGLGRRTLLMAVAAETGLAVRSFDTSKFVGTDDELRAKLRELSLACRLDAKAPLIANADSLGARAAIVGEELAGIRTPILVTCGVVRPTFDWGRPVIVVEMAMPKTAQLAGFWLAQLGHGTASDAQQLAEQYPLTPALIHAAAAAANARAGDRALVLADVRAGIQSVLDDRLGQYARRVAVTQTWDDIVLPEEQIDTVFELVARVRRRCKVYEQWGFAAKVGRGLGVTALFSGPPGTGKTMIASLVAKELGLELYQVDMGKVVSKFIGETEKNLGALFDAAEAGHAILLFDEADALFGKRTDVKSSNDRYANLETNYLLQRLETFTGICLLTSNHEKSIDPAFQRRLSLHLRFELPDAEERAKLWQATLPAAAPVAIGINFGSLARRFEMSGGYIRNAALRAAFLAADEDTEITAAHLERAARVEYEGMGKIVA